MPDSSVEPVERWQTKTRSLKSGLNHVLKTMEFADIEIIAGNKKCKAHRLILAARSEVFSKMLYQRENELLKTTFTLKGISSAGCKVLLRYIYTDEIEIMAPDTLFDAYEAATTFALEGLSNACMKQIDEFKIDSENIFSLLNTIAEPLFERKIPPLRVRCLEYAKKNAATLLASEEIIDAKAVTLDLLFEEKCFDNVSQSMILEHIIRWASKRVELEGKVREDSSLPSYYKKDCEESLPPDYKKIREELFPPDGPVLLAKLGIEKLNSSEFADFTVKYCGLLDDREVTMFVMNTANKSMPLPEWMKRA